MINLIGTSPATVIDKIGEDAYREFCGLLLQPNNGNRPEAAHLWAGDNGAFSGFNAARFIWALKKWNIAAHKCLFIVAPDVVCNASATLDLFYKWAPEIKRAGYPVAFVLQNGMGEYKMPYSEVNALFIGGDNAFKFSRYVIETVAEGKKRGLWIHAGRVNSKKRIEYMRAIGADSFDGTGYARYPHRVKNELKWWTGAQPIGYQLPLF